MAKTNKTKVPVVKMISAGVAETKVRKAEQNIISFESKQIEDQSRQFEGIDGVIRPPFNPKWLKLIITHNNTLNQAVAAMEINIDGSGFVIEVNDELKELEALEQEEQDEGEEPVNGEVEDEETESDIRIKAVKEFFDEVSPGVSFLTLRRKLRRDMESIGYAFIEVIRNMEGEVVAMKRVDASTVWLIRLGDAVQAEKTLIRGGKELNITMWVRERRFVQIIGQERVYFKEYGATRDINKKDGAWAKDAETIDFNLRGTELMYFTIDEDAGSPYGVPRWINNLPSALGSRKAEEQNLEFFDAGGIPPVIITVMGGQVTNTFKKQLENFLSGRTTNTRIAVLEVQDAGGTIDGNTGKLKIDVQRFGSEKQNDSLFEHYDERCSERIRSSFRLPPLFIGQIKDFNFATAKTSYMIAESQVFQPERVEFDEIMTKFIIRELNGIGLRFRSLPITLTDAELQLKGLNFATKEKLINPEQITDVVNEITNLGITHDPEVIEDFKVIEEQTRQDNRDRFMAGKEGDSKTPPKPNPKSKSITIVKSQDEVLDLFQLVEVIANAISEDMSEEYKAKLRKTYDDLSDSDKDFVKNLVSMKVFDSTDLDPEGAGELVHGCLHTE